MKKLLNKPLKAFTLYALIVLAGSIPVYYSVVDYIWRDELDDHNELVREKIEKQINALSLSDSELAQSILLWNRIQPGSDLKPVNPADVRPDSFYTIVRKEMIGAEEEKERMRGLSAYLDINGKPFHLVLETNIEETNETIFAITITTVLFFLLLFAGFIILNRRMSASVWQPFYNTLNRLKSFNLDNHQNISFEKTDILEFEELKATLEKLIEANIAVYRQQKEFAENASHELQTPLAVLKSKLDLLLQDKSLTEKQSEAIETLNLSLSRVTRINKNLLLLARLENHQFADNKEINLSELLNEILELFSDMIAKREIVMSKNIQEHVLLFANKSLAEILFSNLVMNAIRHTEAHGKLEIVCNNRELTISNSGKKQLNPESLYKRFISASSETPGSGLGLAIVKEICTRYNWQIQYTFAGSMHTFSILF